MATDQPKPRPRQAGQIDRESIYVVDDEPMLLELAAAVLEPLGYVVSTFRDADAALRAFSCAEVPPALIITDYSMHTMNGLDLMRACRESHPRQKFLLLSGTVDSQAYRDSSIKPDRFLPKPYHAKELAGMVHSLLKR
jgi:CheY-like chemotaxis protein